MKVKIPVDELGTAVSIILSSFAKGNIPASGNIGFRFAENTLQIKAFNGMWVRIEIEVEGVTDDLFLALRSSSLEVISKYLEKATDTIEIDVCAKTVKVGSATMNTISDSSDEELSPPFGIDDVNWIMLPDAVKDVLRVSPGDDTSTDTVPYIFGDGVSSSDGFVYSVVPLDWEFDGIISVPPKVFLALLKAAKGGKEMMFAQVGEMIVMSSGNVDIVSPQFGLEREKAPLSEIFLSDDLVFRSKGSKVSVNLVTELKVAIIQAGGHAKILLFADEESGGLEFSGPGSDLGNSKGKVWSDITGVKICADAHTLGIKVIPESDMWDMYMCSHGESDFIMIKTECGAMHFVSPMHAEESEFDIFKESKDDNTTE